MSLVMFKQSCISPSLPHTPIRNYLHIGYIATRPGAAKNPDGEHGLFGCLRPGVHAENAPWQETARYVRELSLEKKNINRAIISMRPEEAAEAGLVTQADWKEYVEQNIHMIAKENNINFTNLGWCAAFHDETGHPHVHTTFWDNNQKVQTNSLPPSENEETYRKNKIRRQLIKDTFGGRLAALMVERNGMKDAVGDDYKAATHGFENELAAFGKEDMSLHGDSYFGIADMFRDEGELNPIYERLFDIRNAVPDGKKLAYNNMPKDVKKMIDDLIDDLLAENPYLQKAIDKYIDSEVELQRPYGFKFGDGEKMDDGRGEARYRNRMKRDKIMPLMRKNVMSSIRAIKKRERELVGAEYTANMKKMLAARLMHDIMDFLAMESVSNHSQALEMFHGTFGGGELSARARKEWYTSALTTLQLFTTKAVYGITNTSDFSLTGVGVKKQALFIILPDEKTTFYPVASLIVSQQ